MTSILDNELVKRYFSAPNDTPWVSDFPYPEKEFMALRVLKAMEEPVKEGELYLAISEYGKVKGPQAFTSSDNWKFHCQWLRLPDSFQKSREKENVSDYQLKCDNCEGHFVHSCSGKKPDPVEEKISEIYAFHHDGHVLKETASLHQRLYELVDLARRDK